MIRLEPSNCAFNCTPDCRYSSKYIPSFIPTCFNGFLQQATVPSIVYQNVKDIPVFSNEIPCYDLDDKVKCNCTFDQQNNEKFDAYIRFILKYFGNFYIF